jgi:hypothetical protein
MRTSKRSCSRAARHGCIYDNHTRTIYRIISITMLSHVDRGRGFSPCAMWCSIPVRNFRSMFVANIRMMFE